MGYKYLITELLLYKQFGGKKKKWTSLSHNGVMFPPEYIPHNIPVIYNGNNVYLDPLPEEYATLYAKYLESDYIKGSTFRKNFWNDWKKVLGKDHIIKDLDGVNFRPIYEHILKEKEIKKEQKKQMTEEEKDKQKLEEEKFKYAIIDGKRELVGNYRVEPPGIFLGRGCNPKLGKIKPRIFPEDVTLNLSKDAEIPKTIPNHRWGQIVHDQYSQWLASWQDPINTSKLKYVWLAAQSDLRSENDKSKFDLARKLKKKVKIIREANETMLKNESKYSRQIATALYFIDHFALRVGNEKGEDETDTVGVTTLRVENIELLSDNKIKLSFISKDSILYNKIIKVDDIVYQNIKEFIKNKDKKSQVFDEINSNDVNKYLQSFMKSLSARVFRTMNASNVFSKELKKLTKKYENYEGDDKIGLLIEGYNKANLRVAEICNHVRNVVKNDNKQIQNINNMIKKTRAQIKKIKTSNKKNPDKLKKLQDKLDRLKAKRDLKMELGSYSLSTSRINYLDPRISIAFFKQNNIPVDKVFSKQLIERFKWAFDIEPDFKF